MVNLWPVSLSIDVSWAASWHKSQNLKTSLLGTFQHESDGWIISQNHPGSLRSQPNHQLRGVWSLRFMKVYDKTWSHHHETVLATRCFGCFTGVTLGNPPPNSPRLGGRRACHPHSVESHILLSDPSSNLHKITWVRKECPVSAPFQVGQILPSETAKNNDFSWFFYMCLWPPFMDGPWTRLSFPTFSLQKIWMGSETEPGTQNRWICCQPLPPNKNQIPLVPPLFCR